MKAPIRQVRLHTSLCIVQFSKRYLKNPLWTFLMKNQLQTDVCVAFGKSFSSVPLTSSLSTATSQSLSQQSFRLTLLLRSRGSLNVFIIFCYTELFFPRYSESDRTLISSRISRYRISRSS